MILDKKRKEVTLDSETLKLLSLQAEKEGRKLKNYMEHILKQKANDLELSDEYKSMMDEMLERDSQGKVNYATWDKAKMQFQKV